MELSNVIASKPHSGVYAKSVNVDTPWCHESGATDKRVFELARAQIVHSLTVVVRIVYSFM